MGRMQLVHMDIKIIKQKDGGRPVADKRKSFVLVIFIFLFYYY